MTRKAVYPQGSYLRLNERANVVDEFGGDVSAVGSYPLVGHLLFDVGYLEDFCKLGYAHVGIL